MLFWNIWHVKIYLQWPIIYVKYGLGWQWPMLHNTFIVFEWANIWGEEIITEKVYWKVQNGYKIILYQMTKTLFFRWTKTKRCWSSCPFPYKGSKTSASYYHFKEVCDGEIIFCYFFLIRQTLHFYLLGHCFSGHRLPFPPVCQHATFIYCAKYVNTYTGKCFCWHTGGGGTICYKTFPNFYIFPCKKYSFCPKLSPCNSSNGKLIPLS